MRNPCLDPREGDVVQAKLNGRLYQRRVITVTLNDSGVYAHKARRIVYEGTRLQGGMAARRKKVPPQGVCHVSEWQLWCSRYNGTTILRSEEL